MLVKTEVLEEDGTVGEDLCGLAKVAEKPELKLELPPNFIPSRVRPKLQVARVEGGGEEGGGLLLRCPKCSITYRSRASMKNHTAVCKAGGAAEKDCDAGADKLGCVRQAKEGIAINDVHVTAYVPKRA